MDKNLDEIGLKFGTDKSSNGHNYMPLYEKHLPGKVNKFLEIGCLYGAGIQTFKEWYGGEGQFYAMDRFIEGHGLITIGALQALGINAFQGDQKDMSFLEHIKDQFTVIIDDASHHWLDQIITFKVMFHRNIEPDGVYVIEDIFDEPYWGQGVVKNASQNIKSLLRKWQAEGNLVGEFFSQEESNLISPLIKEVTIYDNIVFVVKK